MQLRAEAPGAERPAGLEHRALCHGANAGREPGTAALRHPEGGASRSERRPLLAFLARNAERRPVRTPRRCSVRLEGVHACHCAILDATAEAAALCSPLKPLCRGGCCPLQYVHDVLCMVCRAPSHSIAMLYGSDMIVPCALVHV